MSDDPYAFILNSGPTNQPHKQPKANGADRKILVIALAAIGVLVLVVIVTAIISTLSKTSDELFSVRSYQAEISRVIKLGDKNLTDPVAREKFTTLQLVLLTDQSQTDAAIASKNLQPTAQQLSQHQDSGTETDLENAIVSGNHDELLTDLIDSLTSDYYTSLNTALNTATTATEKEALNSAKQNIELVYQQQ